MGLMATLARQVMAYTARKSVRFPCHCHFHCHCHTATAKTDLIAVLAVISSQTTLEGMRHSSRASL